MSADISNSISVFPYLMYIDNSIFFFDHVEMLILALLLPTFYVQRDDRNCKVRGKKNFQKLAFDKESTIFVLSS